MMVRAQQGPAGDADERLRELDLAVCSLVHALSNDLTLANGGVELALEMELSPDVRACLIRSAAALTALTEHVAELHRVGRLAVVATPAVAD
jgi:hypothetical protein